jgi:hypothetical protein
MANICNECVVAKQAILKSLHGFEIKIVHTGRDREDEIYQFTVESNLVVVLDRVNIYYYVDETYRHHSHGSLAINRTAFWLVHDPESLKGDFFKSKPEDDDEEILICPIVDIPGTRDSIDFVSQKIYSDPFVNKLLQFLNLGSK